MPPSQSLAAVLDPPPQAVELVRASELQAAGTAAWRLGWPELDEALPWGVPRAQVTEWAGPRSAGKTAALRQLVWAVLNAGAGAAYIDGTGTLTPAPWVVERSSSLSLPSSPLFWVVRPPQPTGVLTAAGELLASGVFGLVIAEGADWTRTPVVRLQRLARQVGAALVAVVERTGGVPLAGLRVEFDPAATSVKGARGVRGVRGVNGERRVRVRGRGRIREVSYAQKLPYRLPDDSGLPDRRA